MITKAPFTQDGDRSAFLLPSKNDQNAQRSPNPHFCVTAPASLLPSFYVPICKFWTFQWRSSSVLGVLTAFSLPSHCVLSAFLLPSVIRQLKQRRPLSVASAFSATTVPSFCLLRRLLCLPSTFCNICSIICISQVDRYLF